MHIDIINSAREIFPDRVKNKTVVVIDVLRATSVMVTALANGAKEIIPTTSPNKAFAIKQQLNHKNIFIGGEQDAIQVKGFDFGNSPFSYTSEIITGKTIIMSTSNGTKAIHGALPAKKIWIGSFLNDRAIINALTDCEEVVLVCSGSKNVFTLEDALCAGKMAYDLQQNNLVELSDMAINMSLMYAQNKTNIQQIAAQGSHYQILEKKGFLKDLNYCFLSDRFNITPYLNSENKIVL